MRDLHIQQGSMNLRLRSKCDSQTKRREGPVSSPPSRGKPAICFVFILGDAPEREGLPSLVDATGELALATRFLHPVVAGYPICPRVIPPWACWCCHTPDIHGTAATCSISNATMSLGVATRRSFPKACLLLANVGPPPSRRHTRPAGWNRWLPGWRELLHH